MHGRGPLVHARLRERRRCAAILTSPVAARSRGLAMGLAFGTGLPRSEALALLERLAPLTALTPPEARAQLAAAAAPSRSGGGARANGPAARGRLDAPPARRIGGGVATAMRRETTP